ncbi:1-acyl-sn-glycerol-3-phosphate acyltransferase 1, chloroplastic-like isoform X1 [Coffea eugenioides]|uniref:1-acyl-sn-glycerol-3-phosphate acyltransferase 1, chloroplastic-like isoform X1 n=1 Tax=Coffea eugenioides TaxID=49369 RepID=UPI000F6133C4|nr:1-acyl-sn-glycerol-3-phosphate acyltransferase 1, chloroplastic-like isoform X1 [Coffea eugenioides]
MVVSYLSSSSKFANFQFHPSPPLHHFRQKPAGFFLCTSVRPKSNAHDRFRFGLFPLKHSTWRISNIYDFTSKRRCAHASRLSFCPVEKFCGVYDECVSDRCKLSRCIIRSDISASGSATASYPLSESQAISKFRGICFYAVTSFVAIFLFVLMVVAHPFVLLFDKYRRKAQHLIAKVWALLTISPFLKMEFEGLHNLPAKDAPAVYVSNHQSFLDIYTLLTLGKSFKFISKTSIFLFPIIGWAMYFLGTIPLKRLDSRSQLDCLKRCMDLVKKGASVFFFPEGTRSKDGKLGTFKKGAFSVAVKTGVPVIPVTLIGTGKIMPAGMEGRLNPGGIKVVIHPPIEGKDPDFLCSEARKKIADVLIREGYET